jgi:hypothetical protein
MRRKNLKRQADSTYAEIVISDKNTSGYDTTKCLKELLSADDILNRIRLDRSLLFKRIRKMEPVKEWNPFENILSVDDNCLCQGGWGLRPFVNKQYCVGCELMRRISKGIKIPEDSIITIEYGQFLGNSYSIVNCDNTFSTYKRTKEYEVISRDLLSKLTISNLYDPIFNDINNITFYYSTLSPITNYIVICSILQNKLNKYKIPTAPLFEWSFQCGKSTYILENYPNMGFGTLKNLVGNADFAKGPKSPTARKSQSMTINPVIILGFIKQLTSTLHFLAKYSYTHGNPTIRHISFTKKPCFYKYDGVEITGPITMHLIPSNDSAITLENDNGEFYRFLNSGYVKHLGEKDHILESFDLFVQSKIQSNETIHPSIVPLLPEIENNLVYGYKIGNCYSFFKEVITQKGIPLLNQSFDFYMFMFSLMTEEVFFTSFSEHSGLVNLWKELFLMKEYESVMEDLKNFRSKESEEPISFDEILEKMSKYTFRVDAMKYFWEKIKIFE